VALWINLVGAVDDEAFLVRKNYRVAEDVSGAVNAVRLDPITDGRPESRPRLPV
jgi:hypothetical protein